MADKIIENNQVSIMGKIDTGFTFSHQVFGERLYTEGPLSEERLRICFLQSTVRMASRITYHVSAGAEMRDMLRLSQ